MSNHLSPEKRLRRDKKKQLINKARISQVRTLVKKVHHAAKQEGQDTAIAQGLFQQAQSALARAASRGVIHRKTAARKTGRLMKLVQQSPNNA